MKILLVEDIITIRRENQRALTDVGYEVICAEDGESALRQAQEQKPDLILLEMILRKISGPEVLRQLKGDPRTADIPVVVLTGLSEKNREKLIEAGAEDYLEKNSLVSLSGTNILPQVLDNLMCRVNRRKRMAAASAPINKGREPL
jgi:CheY-like chemotaxis protein